MVEKGDRMIFGCLLKGSNGEEVRVVEQGDQMIFGCLLKGSNGSVSEINSSGPNGGVTVGEPIA